jgi:hypothetical protein
MKYKAIFLAMSILLVGCTTNPPLPAPAQADVSASSGERDPAPAPATGYKGESLK